MLLLEHHGLLLTALMQFTVLSTIVSTFFFETSNIFLNNFYLVVGEGTPAMLMGYS